MIHTHSQQFYHLYTAFLSWTSEANKKKFSINAINNICLFNPKDLIHIIIAIEAMLIATLIVLKIEIWENYIF